MDGTIVEYYEKNPQKRPTIVLVNLPYIGQDIKGYLDSTFFGEYLEENEYKAIDSNDTYVVFRK